MTYDATRMRKLLEVDKFLLGTYEEVKRGIGDDNVALEIVFQTYVIREPIIQNAYLHLT
ncbi:hypothetical protein [Bacillus sp. FJAT-45350]|uniref:hypothetical protein n=1 Tax=Bacillus sp. FJAT-45350 TaxID=2011014 RepID=UPI0015CD6DA2|nr:hypothetical protein [Bacillus sp. FJAT-45350]